MYILIYTDGYSLDNYTFYDSFKNASKAMKKAYDQLDPKEDNDIDFAEMSYCSEAHAILFDNGENVHAWNIIEISASTFVQYTKFSKTDICKMFNALSLCEQDSIYRRLWGKHVKEDVKARAEEIEANLDEAAIDKIVYSYVELGHYDCNLCYWDNIDNLIEEEAN